MKIDASAFARASARQAILDVMKMQSGKGTKRIGKIIKKAKRKM